MRIQSESQLFGQIHHLHRTAAGDEVLRALRTLCRTEGCSDHCGNRQADVFERSKLANHRQNHHLNAARSVVAESTVANFINRPSASGFWKPAAASKAGNCVPASK